ncbi:MAG: hypothetical protein DWQ02_17100 [Bacteroidetes bacterium]|nr:MAG: hypothetical protein DWQ02_17100 [Bacteroidota bacterium]
MKTKLFTVPTEPVLPGQEDRFGEYGKTLKQCFIHYWGSRSRSLSNEQRELIGELVFRLEYLFCQPQKQLNDQVLLNDL